MSKIYENIGKRIREERLSRNLSLEELAEKAEIAPSFVGQIERGIRKLSVGTLEKVALAFDICPADLLRDIAPKRSLIWERRISSLLRDQPNKRKMIIFKTLKYLLWNVLRG